MIYLVVLFNFLILAAHFYRNGIILGAILSVIFPFILFLKNKYSIILIKIGLIFSMFVWAETFFKLWDIYSRYNIPFKTTAIIIFVVIVYSIFTYFLVSKYTNNSSFKEARR